MEDFNLRIGEQIMVKLRNGNEPPWFVAKGIVSCIAWEKGHEFPRLFLRDLTGAPEIFFNPANLAVYGSGNPAKPNRYTCGVITRLVDGC